MTNEELANELQASVEGARSIQAQAEADKRHLTDEESATIARLLDESERVQDEIDLRARLNKNEQTMTEKLATPQPRLSEPDPPEKGRPSFDRDDAEVRRVPAQAADHVARAKGGFRSFGEFAQ